MRKQLIQWGCTGFAGLLALPGVAFAQQQAYTNSPVNMCAGPAEDYPAVAQLPGGVPVTVMGCVSDYSWCDVVVPNLRGWVYRGRSQLSVSGRQCTDPDLRNDDRLAYRDVFHRLVLG